VEGNHIHSNGDHGLYIVGCNGNEVTGNRVENNGHAGILLGGSYKCRVERNLVQGNGGYGIRLQYKMAMNGGSYENTIRHNVVRYHEWGIHLQKSYHNEILENLIELNSEGVRAEDDSADNRIFCNNFSRNHEQAYDGCGNSWDNGKKWGGNFWSGLKGEDLDGDRFLDDPFRIPGKTACDFFPRVVPVPIFVE
jgi:parallel beta-helix repeat protein